MFTLRGRCRIAGNTAGRLRLYAQAVHLMSLKNHVRNAFETL